MYKRLCTDLGVVRALCQSLSIPIQKSTSAYGSYFEAFFISECIRLNSCFEKDFKFSFLLSKDDVEIDLIVERPGLPPVLIEIKSSEKIDERHVQNLVRYKKDFPKAQLICASQVKVAQKTSGVDVIPWQDVFELIGLSQ